MQIQPRKVPAVFLTSFSWRRHCQSAGHSGCQGSKPVSLKGCAATPTHQSHQQAYLNADENSAMPRRCAGNDCNHTVGWRNSTRLHGRSPCQSPALSVPSSAIQGPELSSGSLGFAPKVLKTKNCRNPLKRKKEAATLLGLRTTQCSHWTPAWTSSWSGAELDHHQLGIPEGIKTAPVTSSKKGKTEGGGRQWQLCSHYKPTFRIR